MIQDIMKSQKSSIQIGGQMISRLIYRDSVIFHLEEGVLIIARWSGMVYASSPKPTYKIGSSNYTTFKVWYENEIITKKEVYVTLKKIILG
jgi:hypothetical protein